MDIVIYGIALVAAFAINNLMSKEDDIGISSAVSTYASQEDQVVYNGAPIEIDLPVGNNLHLYKESDAFTLILEQLGLK